MTVVTLVSGLISRAMVIVIIPCRQVTTSALVSHTLAGLAHWKKYF